LALPVVPRVPQDGEQAVLRDAASSPGAPRAVEPRAAPGAAAQGAAQAVVRDAAPVAVAQGVPGHAARDADPVAVAQEQDAPQAVVLHGVLQPPAGLAPVYSVRAPVAPQHAPVAVRSDAPPPGRVVSQLENSEAAAPQPGAHYGQPQAAE